MRAGLECGKAQDLSKVRCEKQVERNVPGHAHTVAAARCPMTFFYAPKDVEKRSAAAISVHRFAAKSVLPWNIVKLALRNVSKVPWRITSYKPRTVTSTSTKIPLLYRYIAILWRSRAWTGT